MDWNDDGKKDLLVGERDGYIRVYLNMLSDVSPVFGGYKNIKYKTGGDFDCGLNAVPAIVDWDDDGDLDILCGEDEGKVILLVNQASAWGYVFTPAGQSFIQDGGADLDVGGKSSPTVVDWNRDGKKDLIVGNSDGNLLYFENKGTSTSPAFNGSVLLEAAGKPIDVYQYARPDVVDWNGDNVMDILCGNYSGYPNYKGYVFYFEAQGPLSLSSNFLSAAKGGSTYLNLSAGTVNSSRHYIILGSVTGTAPGVPLPGGITTLPINWDVFTDLALSLMNSQAFAGFMGTLKTGGKATAKFDTLGPLPSAAIGLTLSFAYALNAPWDYASNAVSIEIVP